jgi:hypothetical protein
MRRIRLSLLTFALAAIAAVSIIAVASAGHHTATLSAGPCYGSGGTSFASGNGYTYTSTSSCTLDYLYTTWSVPGGWATTYSPWTTDNPGGFAPANATYGYGSHNVCTAGYATCNGYVNTYDP